ncbi:hypothetical protein MJO28_017760 [Puccinia striiformis f. sp. tritici]|nr:hypothetical protein MJO28_017760 [Puccinia striiformis f. sp. tritici]KAI7955767.1 hypothetical protein MJO29_007166 [Puccinia striiformis f. sp. tritici]
MSANVITVPSRVLCGETQPGQSEHQETQIPPETASSSIEESQVNNAAANEADHQTAQDQLQHPPRTISIGLDYKLYVENPHRYGNTWEPIGPRQKPNDLVINIQSVTWCCFQALVVDHLGANIALYHGGGQIMNNLPEWLNNLNVGGDLTWLAFIESHRIYPTASPAHIEGPKTFTSFGLAAYHAFPARVAFQLVMRQMPGVWLPDSGEMREDDPSIAIAESIKSIISKIQGPSGYLRDNGMTLIPHPVDCALSMLVHPTHMFEWAEAIHHKEPEVNFQNPPNNKDYVWTAALATRKQANHAPATPAQPSKRVSVPSENDKDFDKIEVSRIPCGH